MLNLLLSASLVYGAFLVLKCPCKVPCACRFPEFALAVGLPLGYVALQNTLTKA